MAANPVVVRRIASISIGTFVLAITTLVWGQTNLPRILPPHSIVPFDTTDVDDDEDLDERVPIDLDGNTRFIDILESVDSGVGTAPIADMGAFEQQRDCNGNGVPDDLDLNVVPDPQVFATGFLLPEDIVRSQGTYPPQFLVTDLSAATVWNVSAGGGEPTALATGLNGPLGATFVPNEFGGQGIRLLVALRDQPSGAPNVVWIKADGSIAPLFEVARQGGITGLVYVPPALDNSASGSLLVTSFLSYDGGFFGSVYLVDSSGTVTTVVPSVGASIFTPALAPNGFGQLGEHAFFGDAFGGDLRTADILALNLHSFELTVFATVVLDVSEGGIRQLAFSPIGWAAPLAPSLSSESVLLVSVSGAQFGGGAGGAVLVYDQRGLAIAHLSRGSAEEPPAPFDPRGLLFDGQDVLISNTANRTLLRATVADFALLDVNEDEIPDVCQDCNGNGAPDECDTLPPFDFDFDGDVDLIDLAGFQRCFTGPGPAKLGPCCTVFDFECDGDVDLADFVAFRGVFAGP